ncbi:hypothetical protein ACFRMN_33295 [Streptomyces sp. NPDC056835]|uniref:hypothetical protein n=1 Tax=Streptomyces sp. NPDC056835 TaxID=3345956 RepID=UPI0036CA4B14
MRHRRGGRGSAGDHPAARLLHRERGRPGRAPPPVHANFDYQIGEPCTPPAGVKVVIEYKEKYFKETCAGFGDRLSAVLRDVDVTAPGNSAYVRKTC